MTSEDQPTDAPQTTTNYHIDRKLFAVVTTLLIILCGFLISNLYLQWNNYAAGIEAATNTAPVNHIALLTYSRAMDFAFVKTSTIFIGFLLVLLGTLYLLRASEAAYSLEAQNGDNKLTFTTASPGLVLATLGVITVLGTIYKSTSVKFEASNKTAASSQAENALLQANTVDVQNLEKEIEFKFDSFELTESGQQKFDQLCNYIKRTGYSPVFNPSGDPGTGREYALALAQKRAETLLDLANEKCRPPKSITRIGRTVSIGEGRPAISVTNEKIDH